MIDESQTRDGRQRSSRFCFSQGGRGRSIAGGGRTSRRIDYNVTGIPAAMVIMGIAGVLSGLLGIGAGAVKVLAHEIAMKVPTKVITAAVLGLTLTGLLWLG